MNYLSFIASVVGSLAIPVTVVTAVVIFRRPLADLIGRVSSYEGMGQKVTFGRELASAEAAVSVAVAQAREAAADNPALDGNTNRASKPGPTPDASSGDRALQQITSAEPNFVDVDLQNAGLLQLAEIASSNPSFTIIKAYDELESALSELADTVMSASGKVGLPYRNDILASARFVSESFVDAVRDLRELRNRVAHGQHNPTAGEAVTYVESVRKLVAVVVSTTASNKERLRTLADVKAALEGIVSTPETADLRRDLEMRQQALEAQLSFVMHR